MEVPLSTTEPIPEYPFHVRLSRNYYPNEDETIPIWAKCDLICSVSLVRLDRIKVGVRRYFAPTVSSEDLEAVRKGVYAAIFHNQFIK